jgi:protein-S-isoprenylcysteine O-methyltransferase Ste14
VSDGIEGNGDVGPNASNGTPGAGPPGSPPSRPRRPLGAVIASAVDGARTLVRKQVELARIEMTEAVSVRAKGAGMMAAAAVLGLFALGFAAASGSAALDLVLPSWAAHLIVAGVLVAIAGALILAGRRAIRTAPTTPERTQETLKEDARWARQQLTR